jgi:PAS domain S-box-containing protein
MKRISMKYAAMTLTQLAFLTFMVLLPRDCMAFERHLVSCLDIHALQASAIHPLDLLTIHVTDPALSPPVDPTTEFAQAPAHPGVGVQAVLALTNAGLRLDVVLMAISEALLKLNAALQRSLEGFVSKLMTGQMLLSFIGVLMLMAAWVVLVLRRRMLAKIAEVCEAVRLQSEALKAVEDGILILDRRGDIQWVNPGFSTLTGYSVKEVIGRNFRMLESDQHPQDLYRTMWSEVLTGNVWRNELTSRHKDGSLHEEELTITPVWDESGNPPSHFIAVNRDISGRKRAQDDLQESESRHHRFIGQEFTEPVRPLSPFDPIHKLFSPTDSSPRTETSLAAVFDRTQFLSRLSDDEGLAQEVTAMFLDECPKLMQEVHHAVRQRNAEDLSRAAHALKGAVGDFAASQAFDAAQAVEHQARNGDLTGIETSVTDLEAAVARLATELADVRKQAT